VAAVLLGTGWGANQFSPMLLVYHRTLGLSTGTLEAMFGVYALGLIPGLLLVGPLSDARGRRPVVISAAALSLLASGVLIAGAHAPALLFVGRLLAGISSGAVFGAGTAWLRELSLPPFGTASAQATARRAAIWMTTGFALGPLTTGLVAQWSGAPRVLPYLPHLALMAFVVVALAGAPETVPGERGRPVKLSVPGIGHPRFRRLVAPMAPWVFAGPVIGFALLPSAIGVERQTHGIALTAVITALTAGSGVLVQPLGRRLHETRGLSAARAGLLVVSAGFVLAALTAQTHASWLLVPSAIVLGAAYGLCLVAGLVEVQAVASDGALARLTAAFYTLTYLGFAAPYLLALASPLAGYPVLLLIGAAAALATALRVTRHGRTGPVPSVAVQQG
jgi:hypothetical protein